MAGDVGGGDVGDGDAGDGDAGDGDVCAVGVGAAGVGAAGVDAEVGAADDAAVAGRNVGEASCSMAPRLSSVALPVAGLRN